MPDLNSTWEEMYNPNFKVFESEHFKKDVGLVTFTPSVSEWVEKTDAIGLFVKKGRYGGTFAHKDIAFEFASAISPVFKLYLIKEFQRLKEQENDLKKIEWTAKRFLSKNNYLIQTDAVKNYLIPVCNYREDLQWLPYAEEADLLNVAIFGFTAKAWRDEYLKWLCGFANAQGGTIYIGIDDGGNVFGVKDVKKLMEDIPNKIKPVLGIVADVNKHTKDGKDYLERVKKYIFSKRY